MARIIIGASLGYFFMLALMAYASLPLVSKGGIIYLYAAFEAKAFNGSGIALYIPIAVGAAMGFAWNLIASEKEDKSNKSDNT